MQETCKCKDCGHEFQKYTSDKEECPYCKSKNIETIDIAF